MKTSNATRHFVHRARSGRQRSTLIVLGLLTAAVIAIAVVDGEGTQTHAAAPLAAREVDMNSFNAALSPGGLGSTSVHHPRPAGDTNDASADVSRECLLEKGIVDECTFN